MKRLLKTVMLIMCFILVTSPAFAAISEVNRLWGEDRYKTALAISKQHQSGLVNAVVLVPGSNFANALPASVLAFKQDAPVLLVDLSADKTKEAFDYIISHLTKIGTIYLVGDNSLVGPDFEIKLKQLGYNNIVRVSGNDKYETGHLVAKQLGAAKGTPVVISSGENFPDALSISSFAAANGWPVLFTGCNFINTHTENYVKENKPETIYITGGTGVISASVEDRLKVLAPNAVIKRLGGADRYETSVLIAREFAPVPSHLYITSGLNFPDALAGSVLAAKNNGPVLLVNPLAPGVLPPSVKSYLNKLKEYKSNMELTLFGGLGVIPAELEHCVALEGGFVLDDLVIAEDEVLQMVNAERVKNGLEVLHKNDVLTQLARLKSQDMIDKKYFDHESPTYGTSAEMLKSFGVKYQIVGENIAVGQLSAKEVMNDWMNSPPHKANILKEDYQDIGIGIARDSQGRLYWTQLFIR